MAGTQHGQPARARFGALKAGAQPACRRGGRWRGRRTNRDFGPRSGGGAATRVPAREPARRANANGLSTFGCGGHRQALAAPPPRFGDDRTGGKRASARETLAIDSPRLHGLAHRMNSQRHAPRCGPRAKDSVASPEGLEAGHDDSQCALRHAKAAANSRHRVPRTMSPRRRPRKPRFGAAELADSARDIAQRLGSARPTRPRLRLGARRAVAAEVYGGAQRHLLR